MDDEKEPPEIILEIDEADAEKPSVGKALEAAMGAAGPLDKKLRIIDRTFASSALSDKMRLFEENSDIRRMAESLRLFDEHSGIRQFQNSMGLLGENSVLKQFSESMRLLELNSPSRQVVDRLKATGELTRAALGPAWELREAGILNIPALRGMEDLGRALKGFEAHFRLPEFKEATRLANMLGENSFSKVAAGLLTEHDSFRRAIERMNTPWLDIRDNLRSISGFAEMQGIGHTLRNLRGFDEHVTGMLRLDLGDWRDPITWRPEVLEDLGARSEFYVGLGFNPGLTEFPLPAFQQSMDVAGLRDDVPPLIEHYGPPVPFAGDDEEEGLARTNTAHDWLQRLERLLRRFIDEQMTRAFGADWPKHRLPNGLYDKWREEKRDAREAGAADLPLISYADFTEYCLIICKRDNWTVFSPFFQRPESLRESFQRLHPIRLDTAHARLITQDDELLLYVEVKRLLRAIGALNN